MEPITDVREIAHIANGFKASKALLVGIDLELFTRLSGQSKTLPVLVDEVGIASNRLETLLTALTSLGLLAKNGESYSNAPACEKYLVKGKPAYFGDYFNLQTDQFIFPAYNELGSLIRGTGRADMWGDYESLMQDREVADRFSRGQHAGSMGPALALTKQVDLGSSRNLLDVAGGSGAFTIVLCQRNQGLSATIFDFPAVLAVAERLTSEAGLAGRVRFQAGNVLTSDWPPDHDTVLMSYLFSAVDEVAISNLLQQAYGILPVGGTVIVHDFMVKDDKTGPPDAALWFLTCMFNCPEGMVLTPRFITDRLAGAGFTGIEIKELVPGLTRMAVARKP